MNLKYIVKIIILIFFIHSKFIFEKKFIIISFNSVYIYLLVIVYILYRWILYIYIVYVSIHLSIVYYIINILKNLVTNIHNELLISNLFKIFFVILEKLIDYHITIAMYCNIKILIILSKNCLIFYFRSILIEDITSREVLLKMLFIIYFEVIKSSEEEIN